MYDGLKHLEIPTRPKRTRRKWVVRLALLGIASFVLVYGSNAWFTYQAAKNRFDKSGEKFEELVKAAPNEPVNVLIVGSDRRDVVTAQQRKLAQFNKSSSGERSDTIILLHISKDKRAVMVSFPRDLRVKIPGYGYNKINAAYAFGGSHLLIKTVEEFSNLPINHYVEINFVAFQSVVDAVGGVRINVAQAIHDKKSGLNIPHAGCWDMRGLTALNYVRARYFDPRADLGRIDRQQEFMRALMRKVKRPSFLFNLENIDRLSQALFKGVIHDDRLELGEARGIGAKLASTGENKIDFRIVPNDPQYVHGVSYVIARPSQTARLFDAIRSDTDLPRVGLTAASLPKPKDIQIDVYNGTGKSGMAAKTAATLRAKGFEVRYARTAPKKYAVTTIVYQPGAELKAKLLQSRYYKTAVLVPADDTSYSDLHLYLGVDVLPVPSGSPTPGAGKARVDTVCRKI